MQIEAVEFVDFRNYPTLLLTPAPGLNILTGSNAQGKTNLLEGLAVLAVGRSFRRAKPIEMARWGATQATVRGGLIREDASRPVRRVLAPREDGIWSVSGEGCAWARVIPFGWADLSIVSGAPQARRDFIDGFVAKLYPAYAAVHQRYRQVLARRNHLLQSGGSPVVMPGRLAPWNVQLVDTGLEIVDRRRQAVAALSREVEMLYPALGGRGQVELAYQSALGEAPTADTFQSALEARLGDEVRRGQTLVGPHRDDLMVLVNRREMRLFGSRGQQRLLALTLRLAEASPVEAALGSAPVLLLDDALSELDPGVQQRVLDHVSRVGQVFLTTAEVSLPDAGESRWWEVNAGMVRDTSLAALGGAA